MLKHLSPSQKFLLTVACVVLVAVLWLGGGIMNLVHNKLEMRRLTKKRDQLDAQYEHLLAEKKLLEDKDSQYMETLARMRYNLVKPGEIEFRFTPHD